MYNRVNYTIVGIFVLLFGAGVIGFTFWLAKYGMVSEHSTYKLYMRESIAGLSKDSTVRLRGVNIGRVSKIRINPKNIEEIEVFLKIDSTVPIKEDMVAHTQMLGITGLLSIEIDGGTNSSANLKATNEFIPVIPTTQSWLTKTTQGLGTLSEDIGTILKKIKEVLNKQNIDNISNILHNTNIIASESKNIIREFNSTIQIYRRVAIDLNSSIDSLSKDFTKVSDSTVPMLESFKKDFTKITNSTIPTLESIRKASNSFNKLSLKFESSIKKGDYNLRDIFEPMLVDIGILTEQMSDLSRELESSPNGLLFKSRKTRKGPGE